MKCSGKKTDWEIRIKDSQLPCFTIDENIDIDITSQISVVWYRRRNVHFGFPSRRRPQSFWMLFQTSSTNESSKMCDVLGGHLYQSHSFTLDKWLWLACTSRARWWSVWVEERPDVCEMWNQMKDELSDSRPLWFYPLRWEKEAFIFSDVHINNFCYKQTFKQTQHKSENNVNLPVIDFIEVLEELFAFFIFKCHFPIKL